MSPGLVALCCLSARCQPVVCMKEKDTSYKHPQKIKMATSFKKKGSRGRTVYPSGTKPSLHNNQLLISSGVPSLDSNIGDVIDRVFFYLNPLEFLTTVSATSCMKAYSCMHIIENIFLRWWNCCWNCFDDW